MLSVQGCLFGFFVFSFHLQHTVHRHQPSANEGDHFLRLRQDLLAPPSYRWHRLIKTNHR